MPLKDKDNTSLEEYTTDFERLQNQKVRYTGGFEARVLTNLAFLSGEQYVTASLKRLVITPLDANKLHLVFNLAKRLMNKVIGRLLAIAGTYKARPDRNDPKARADAEVVDKLIKALDEKVGQPSRTWELLYWMAVAGVAFEYVPWIKDAIQEPLPQFDPTSGELMWKNEATGETVPESARQQAIQAGAPQEMFSVVEEMSLTGDVGSEILSPLQVFIDSSVRSVEDISPDQAVYIARIRTVGWIEENFPDLDPETLESLRGIKDLKIVSTSFMQSEGASTGNTHLNDLIPRIQGSRDANDPEMVVVVERYMKVSSKHPRGSYCVFIPGEVVLLEGDNPYEEIPLVDFHWSPPTTNFWTQDYITDLIAPQRFLNKRMSQLGEQSNASIYSNELLGPGLSADKIPADYPAPIEGGVNDQGMKMIQRRDPPQLPNWFLHSIDLSIKLLREIAGGSDLFDENAPYSQMRGPMAVPMLQEILDTEWGPLYEHIGERTARVKQMRMNRVKKFYPPYRTLHYMDKDMQDEVFVFHNKQILGAGVEYRITVERGSLLPELRALREQRVAERVRNFPILYTDERTGRLDKTKIASDLHYGDAARESAEAQARKLAGELIERMEKGLPLPEWLPLPFWDHRAIMDELEAHMSTTEFIEKDPQTIQTMLSFWDRCRARLTEIMQAQQNSVQDQMIQGAVAQATQQSAAKAAAEAIDATIGQVRASALEAQHAPEAMARAEADQQAQNAGPRRA